MCTEIREVSKREPGREVWSNYKVVTRAQDSQSLDVNFSINLLCSFEPRSNSVGSFLLLLIPTDHTRTNKFGEVFFINEMKSLEHSLLKSQIAGATIWHLQL